MEGCKIGDKSESSDSGLGGWCNGLVRDSEFWIRFWLGRKGDGGMSRVWEKEVLRIIFKSLE